MLTAIDICCGAGGWAIAARSLPIQIVAAIDKARDCLTTHKYNHPEIPTVEALVEEVDFARFAGVDLVLGAVPCEEISVARNGNPVATETLKAWHNLLDGILAGVQVISPKYWCLENVRPMKRHLPPLTPQVLLNSSDFSGQRRERLFVGNFPLPKSGGDSSVLADYLLPGPYLVSDYILSANKVSNRQWYQKGTVRVLNQSRKSPTITDFGSRHSRGFVVALADGRKRSLYFQEAARLQGFPPDYVFASSQSRAWKMVAQAIPIPLGRAILEAIVAKEG